MGKIKTLVRRSLALMPAIVLAIAWWGMWLYWPHGPASVRGRAAPRSAAPPTRFLRGGVGQFAVHLMPDLFGRGRDVGFRAANMTSHTPPDVPMTLDLPARTLAWSATDAARRVRMAELVLGDAAKVRLEGHIESCQSGPLFSEVSNRVCRFAVTPGGALRAATVAMDPAARDALAVGERPWSAAVWVTLGEEGQVLRALLEKRTGDAALDRQIVGAMFRSYVTGTGDRRSGSIQLDYGCQ